MPLHSRAVRVIRSHWPTGLTILAFLPPAIMLVVAWHFTVNLPRSDDWTIVAPVIVEARAGKLSWDHLHAQVGDARMPVPRLVHAALALSTDWDQHYESAAILFFTFLTFLYFLILLGRAFPRAPGKRAVLSLAGSLLIFWPAMGMYWTFPTTLCYAIGTSLVLAIVLMMGTRWHPVAKVIGGACLAFLAGETFLSGWLAWGVLLVLTLLNAWQEGWRRRWPLAIGVVLLALGLALFDYLPGWESHVGQAKSGGVKPSLLEYTVFFCRWMGSPFSSAPFWIHDLAPAAQWQMNAGLVLGGTFVLGIASISVLALIRCLKDRTATGKLAPWLAITAFAIAAGVLVTLGRTRFSPTFCFLGRYVSFSIWAYLGAAGLFLTLWSDFPSRGRDTGILCAGLPVFLLLYAFGFWRGLLTIEADHFATQRFRAAFELMPLYVGKSPDIEADVLDHPFSPPPEELWRLGRWVKEYGLLRIPLVEESTWRNRLGSAP
ncbi:MAG: hypothetical protein KDM63_17240, partial [Verrucomicrobiae bacterium]|nr:hypothetical protein [Verrucomicrobiae bacterium]